VVNILVIDDEQSVGDALSMVLGDHGYRVVVALNGRDGIELAKRDKFSVVITDLRLPDISGFDVLHCVKLNDSCCPVIIITAHPTPEVVAESKRLGALEVLSKPFFPSDLLLLINAGLNGKPTDVTESAGGDPDQPLA
jgi:DNA-binding NtrC family response regulator